MRWWAVLALCACASALTAAGVVLAARTSPEAGARGSLEIVVGPVIAALVVVQTLEGGREIVLDPRLPALLVAAVLIWRKAPIIVIVLAAGATAALLRLAA